MSKNITNSDAPRNYPLGQRLSSVVATVVLGAYGLVFIAQQFGSIPIV